MKHFITSFWCHLETMVIGLRPIWMSLVINILIAFTIHHEQTIDIVRFVALDNGFFFRIHLMAFLSLSLLMFCNWYYARALLSVRYWFTPEDDRFRYWVLLAPRILFLAPSLSLAVAYLRAQVIQFSLFYLLWPVLFHFVIRFLFRRKADIPSSPKEFPESLSVSTFRFMIVLLVCSGGLLLLFILVPISTPQFIGPLGVLFYTAAAWVAFCSCILAYPVHRFRLPSFVIIGILLGIIFGIWNENHHIRKAPDQQQAVNRPTARKRLHEWLSRHGDHHSDSGGAIPVFIISAEGGGIRAAYWTASVLSHLEETYPGFGTHVFAISGVSGGSLGAAVYTALLADKMQFSKKSPSAEVTSPSLLTSTRKILSCDFLSPAIASFMFPDFMQRFWPFSDRAPFGGKLALPDRATYLERAWEVAWRRGASGNRFGDTFIHLWNDSTDHLFLPALFFNGTWVESGRRLAMSNCLIDTVDFTHLDDIASMLGYQVRLSTAVNMSSRFPYLSPAGTVEINGQKRHVVDGAYFENSGALTAEELMVLLQKTIGANPAFSPFRPVVIIITNTPLNPCSGKKIKPANYKVPKLLIGSSAPVRAFLNSRLARGYLAERQFQKTAGIDNTVRFHLQELEDVSIPLGWILSGKARRMIDQQLSTHPSVGEIGRLMEGTKPFLK